MFSSISCSSLSNMDFFFIMSCPHFMESIFPLALYTFETDSKFLSDSPIAPSSSTVNFLN